MIINCYLLIGANGGIEFRKTLPRQPRLDRIAIHLTINLSNAWFKREIPRMTLDIPDEAILPLPSVQIAPIEEENNVQTNHEYQGVDNQ